MTSIGSYLSCQARVDQGVISPRCLDMAGLAEIIASSMPLIFNIIPLSVGNPFPMINMKFE